MKTKSVIIILISTFFFNAIVRADNNEGVSAVSTHEYELQVGNKSIGDLTVKKTTKNHQVEYNATSHVEVNLFGKINIDYTLDCTFDEGLLIRSEYKTFKNGKLQESTLTTWDKDHYEIVKDGKRYRINEPIYDSAIELYFDKPSHESRIYSEKDGHFKELKGVEDQRYKLTKLGKSKGCEFIYDAQSLENIHTSYLITSFDVKRKD